MVSIRTAIALHLTLPAMYATSACYLLRAGGVRYLVGPTLVVIASLCILAVFVPGLGYGDPSDRYSGGGTYTLALPIACAAMSTIIAFLFPNKVRLPLRGIVAAMVGLFVVAIGGWVA